jgi:hypothetical protein
MFCRLWITVVETLEILEISGGPTAYETIKCVTKPINSALSVGCSLRLVCSHCRRVVPSYVSCIAAEK